MRVLFLDPPGLKDYLRTFTNSWGRVAVSLAYHEAMKKGSTIVNGKLVMVVK